MSQAQNGSSNKVIKARGNATLYYQGGDGKRYVFPNEKTYFSWYDNFDEVTELSEEEIAQLPLAGNVRYRPGVLMVKLQTDPKVYVVGANGLLRWLTNEEVAKKLYGENWNLLIDDVPDSFFANYEVGDPVDEESDFDPEEEETQIGSIAQNRIAARIQAHIDSEIAKTRERLCDGIQKRVNRLQERLERIGIQLDDIGGEYLNMCVDDNFEGDEDGDSDDDRAGKWGRKIYVCHVPDGDENAAFTIDVAKAAARAHLAHGDTLGRCDTSDDDDGDGDNTTDQTAPVISNISSSVSTSTATITWTTDELADGTVVYAEESLTTASTSETVSDSALVLSHSLLLDNLSPSTTYYYMVKSEDGSGNLAESVEFTFTTDAEVVHDTTAPIISDITVDVQASSTIITWNTDEPADSKVTYATESLTTASTTEMLTNASFVTSHSLELESLLPSTTYYFILESSDASNNTAESAEDTFLTL